MSERTRSVGVELKRPIASRPLAASPTTTSGSAPAQSSRSSRKRRLAGASSSTISTRRAESGMRFLLLIGAAVRQADVYFVAILVDAAFERGFRVEMQCQALAYVVPGQLVSSAVTPR